MRNKYFDVDYLLNKDEFVHDQPFLQCGLTRLDLEVIKISELFSSFLFDLLIRPLNKVADFQDHVLRLKDNWKTRAAKLPVMGLSVLHKIFCAVALALQIMLPKMFEFLSRTVTTILDVLVVPFYGATLSGEVESSKVERAVVGMSVGFSLLGAAAWVAVAAGVFTPAVLGASAIATTLITLAWPVTLGLVGVAAFSLIGVGVYRLKKERAKRKSSSSPVESTSEHEGGERYSLPFDDKYSLKTGGYGDPGSQEGFSTFF